MIGLMLKKIIGSVQAGGDIIQNTNQGGHGRGWGDDISWTWLTSAENLQKATGKPIMLIIHRIGCPACAQLKGLFQMNQQIPELSKNFIMVNATPDELLDFTGGREDSSFYPDGKYIPRIMFYHPAWTHLDIRNYNQGEYKYTYNDPWSIRQRMQLCLDMVAK